MTRFLNASQSSGGEHIIKMLIVLSAIRSFLCFGPSLHSPYSVALVLSLRMNSSCYFCVSSYLGSISIQYSLFKYNTLTLCDNQCTVILNKVIMITNC